MMPPLQSMQQGAQAPKPRSSMEMPANIQPKAPTMRPPILPSNSNQIRPGASVSTQTAGQQLAPGHMSAPRAQVISPLICQWEKHLSFYLFIYFFFYKGNRELFSLF